MSLLSMELKVAGNHVITKSLNVLVPLTGILLMLVYDYCDTSCSYLKGSFLGLDLKWVGVVYMAMLFLSAFTIGEFLAALVLQMRTIMISAAVGVEFFLTGFQVMKDIYCPFCLAFGACIYVLFGINFSSMNRWIMVASIFVGLLGFTLLFECKMSPFYDL